GMVWVMTEPALAVAGPRLSIASRVRVGAATTPPAAAAATLAGVPPGGVLPGGVLPGGVLPGGGTPGGTTPGGTPGGGTPGGGTPGGGLPGGGGGSQFTGTFASAWKPPRSVMICSGSVSRACASPSRRLSSVPCPVTWTVTTPVAVAETLTTAD